MSFEQRRGRSRSPERKFNGGASRSYNGPRGGGFGGGGYGGGGYGGGYGGGNGSNPYSTLRYGSSDGMDSNVRPGDWPCMACGGNNFASRTSCFKCHEPKSAGPPGSAPPGAYGSDGYGSREKEVRPNDWECAECNFSNFGSRDSCYKCNRAKPENPMLTINLKNWECEKCFAGNHSRRNDCFKCQSPKPEDAKVVESFADWNCTGCSSMNAARRTNCHKCDGARPGREKELEANPDWKCGGCGINNWSWRPVCYKCNESKPVVCGGEGVGGQEDSAACNPLDT